MRLPLLYERNKSSLYVPHMVYPLCTSFPSKVSSYRWIRCFAGSAYHLVMWSKGCLGSGKQSFVVWMFIKFSWNESQYSAYHDFWNLWENWGMKFVLPSGSCKGLNFLLNSNQKKSFSPRYWYLSRSISSNKLTTTSRNSDGSTSDFYGLISQKWAT